MTPSTPDPIHDPDPLDTSEIPPDMQQNQELLASIEMLESALPELDDPTGVHITLYDMYSDLEDMDQAGRCLVEAARAVTRGNHPEYSFFLYNHLELFAQLKADARDIYERLAEIIGEDSEMLGANTLHLDQRKIYQHDLIPELLLTRHLHHARKISNAERLDILHDLCAHSIHPPLAPQTVLYILHDRSLPHHNPSIEFLAHDAGVPYLNLQNITPDPEAMDLLPPEFIRVRAACPFGRVGGEPMIAVLNPFNLQLREDVRRQLDEHAHYFFTSAAGYQSLLDHSGQ